MIRPAPVRWAALVAAWTLGLAACSGGSSGAGPEPAATIPTPASPTPVDSPLATCEDLTTAAGASPSPAGLPAVTLACFTGGDPVDLASLRGPAVVNLWASWCLPCREELPVLQEFADRTAGEVHVLGVVTQDRYPAAAWLATDLGLRFPALDDPDGEVYGEVGALGLPITLYLDAGGALVYRHQGPLDPELLAEQAAAHLGITG